MGEAVIVWARQAALAGLMLGAVGAGAAPFVPTDEAQIVERLPPGAGAAQRARAAVLASQPQALPLALVAARQAIDRARREGDPRELGSAQAALAPWWREPQAPAPVRLLKATILQSRHDFDAARAELDRLVAEPALAGPLRAQALLTRSSLHQLQGRLEAARQDCIALQPSASARGDAVARAAAVCLLELQSLTGDPVAAQRGLDQLAAPGRADAWLALVQAELAVRLGDDAAARRHFAVAITEGDVYALAACADWLLDAGRNQEALAVLERGPAAADALLLRRAIAWHRLRDARAAAAVDQLRERFAAARQRGDSPHLREEARLALDIDGDAPGALALARQQWAQQKEPADAVLLSRASRAAGQAGLPRELRVWLPDPVRADRRLAAAAPAERTARGLT